MGFDPWELEICCWVMGDKEALVRMGIALSRVIRARA